MATATTKMSSKGQVVIPEEIRDEMGLGVGSNFLVIGSGDTVILKSIKIPSMKEFDGMLKKARNQAKAVGLKKSDIQNAVKAARKK